MNNPLRRRIAAAAIAWSLPTISWSAPTEINYQGRLTDGNGDAVTGNVSMSLKLFDAATGGNEIYSENIGTVTLDDNGVYSFQFGSGGDGIAAALTLSGEHWLELGVNGINQAPRDRVLAVPFAHVAGTANIANAVPDGTITSTKLAPGAAAQNLAASGQATIPSGTTLFSLNRDDTLLTSQGYVMQGQNITTKTAGDPAAIDTGSNPIIVWTGSKVLVWSGGVGAAYNPTTKRWSQISANMFANRGPNFDFEGGYDTFWTGSKVVIQGPVNYFTNEGEEVRGFDIFLYDPATDQWSTASENAPAVPDNNTGADGGNVNGPNSPLWTGSKLIYWKTPSEENTVEGTKTTSIEGRIYDTESNNWSEMATKEVAVAPIDASQWDAATQYENSTDGVTDFIGAWAGDRMIVMKPRGVVVGQDEFGQDVFDIKLVTFAYDPAANSWEDLADSPAMSDSLFKFFSGNLTVSRFRTTWTGSQLIVWGMVVDDPNSSSGPANWLGYTLDIQANRWEEIPSEGAPEIAGPAVESMADVWTGSKLIVGSPEQIDPYTFWKGYAYDPEARNWEALPTEGAIQPDFDAMNIDNNLIFWLGGKLILGRSAAKDGIESLLDGVVYNPTSDSWSAIPPSSVSRRVSSNHSSSLVTDWTLMGDSKVFFWSRANNMSDLGSWGAIYDPTANDDYAWTKLTDREGGEQVIFLYAKP